jgi:hypothetical protein
LFWICCQTWRKSVLGVGQSREDAHIRRGETGLTAQHPWLVAYAFGLLHGLGFASALAQLLLPAGDIPLALLCFNIGVEIGQLLFIGVVIFFGGNRSRLSLSGSCRAHRLHDDDLCHRQPGRDVVPGATRRTCSILWSWFVIL